MNMRWFFLFLFCSCALLSQESKTAHFSVGAQYYYGMLLRHNNNIAHLVREQPQGVLLSYNQKTLGESYWEQAYNYPDWGVSFLYQDFGYEVLGKNYGLYGHFNFYFLNRKLKFRLAQGIAYNTHPFDFEDNFKNVAFGSHLLGSTYFLLQYHEENIVKGVGLQTGVSFAHHSNGSMKAPNTGTNVLGFNIGLVYDPKPIDSTNYKKWEVKEDFSEPIRFNFVLRGGVTESDYFNLGQHPFYVLSAYADKRVNYVSTLQFGIEYFVSGFLKEEIKYIRASFPSRLLEEPDYKRFGLMLGHEFRIGKLGVPTQLGYYVYWPYEYESRVYSRVGVKYYFTPKLFGGITVKTHAANAECIAFGLGVRI